MPALRPMRRLLPVLCLALVAGALAPSRATAQDGKKPPLSGALRAALEKENPTDVQKRFLAAFEAGRLDWEVDAAELNALGLRYMQDGDMERGQVVITVSQQAARLMMADMMPPGMEEAAAAGKAARERQREERASRPTEEEAAAARARAAAGPARDDLDRFHGLFGTEEDGMRRALYLVKSCDGHLRMGATWGDVAPWVLRSTGDTSFEYPGDSFVKPIHVTITTGPDGKATRITHDLEHLGNPLDRIGDLPAGLLPGCDGAGAPRGR